MLFYFTQNIYYNELLCVLWVSILPLSTILIFYFGIIPTVWYFLFLILLINERVLTMYLILY